MIAFLDWVELIYGHPAFAGIPIILSLAAGVLSVGRASLIVGVLIATIVSTALNLLAFMLLAGELGWVAFLLSGFVLCANFFVCLLAAPLGALARRMSASI